MGNPENESNNESGSSGDSQSDDTTVRADWGSNDALHGSGAPQQRSRDRAGQDRGKR